MSGGTSQLDIGIKVLFNYWGEREEGEGEVGQRGRERGRRKEREEGECIRNKINGTPQTSLVPSGNQ